jgi:hypothetical protein
MIMTKLLLATVALVALTSATHAAVEIPAEFHGTWCSTPTDKVPGALNFPMSKTRQDFAGISCVQPEGGFEIEVMAKGFTAYNGNLDCKVTKVDQFMLNNVRKGVLNPWGPAYRVKFRCADQGDRLTYFTTKSWSWQIQKGYISMEVAK